MNNLASYLLDKCKFLANCFWNKCTAFVNNHYIVCSLLIIYICFYRFWEDLIDEYIVSRLLNSFTSNIIMDGLFVLTVIYCFIKCVLLIVREDNHAKRTNLFQDTILLCFWIYYTCFSERFSFTSLSSLNNVYYIDIIPIYFLCKQYPYLWDMITNYCVKENDIHFSRNGFSRDIPIVNKAEDYFERDSIAASEIEKIIETETIKDSFSYGLDATWGSGKTSFMNLMKDHIHKDFSNSCIVMDFNPWLFSIEKNLVTLFFDELSKHLKPYDDTLADSIIDYSKALSSVASASTELKLVTDVLDLSHQSSTLQEKVSRIKDAILNIGKKIVVFVDDIDRLDANELMEMLKLIRNISDFPRMYFVVAYDKSYLLSILKDKMKNKELDFTEKIFQAEFHLPNCTVEDLKDTLYNVLKDHIDNVSDRKEVHDCIFDENKTILSIGAITSLRDIKRLANSFYSSYSKLKGEINARDLLLLEILKVKYPMVYSLLEEKRSDFLIKDNNQKYWSLLPANGITGGERLVIEHYLDSHLDNLSLRTDDKTVLIKILELLFPGNTAYEEQLDKRINMTEYTNRYFNLSINDIPKKRFEDLFKNNIEEVKSRFKQWHEKWPHSLALRLNDYYAKSVVEQTNIIKLFISLVSEDYSSYYSTPAITSMLTRFASFPSKKRIVVDCFKENGFSPNLSKYLFEISNDDNGTENLQMISREEAESIRHYYFSSCIQDPDCEIWRVFDSFRGTANYITHSGLENKRVYYKSTDIDLLRNYIVNHFIDSVSFLFNNSNKNIVSGLEGTDDELSIEYSLNELPLLLWGNWDSFSIVISNVADSSHKKEFLDFFESYKNNNFKPKSFSFRHLSFVGLDRVNQYVDDNSIIMKTIRIFLSSSIALREDRDAFVNFLNRIQLHFETNNYNIQLVTWEDLPIREGVRAQDEYNEAIRQCDIYMVILSTKVGKYTLEEFEIASGEFRKRGLPLLAYFKELKGHEISKDIKSLQNRLDEQGHFWGEYDTNDRLHLDFALWLDHFLLEGKSELKIKDDYVTLGDVNVAELSQLTFVAKNKRYQELTHTLQEQNESIERLQQDISTNPDDKTLIQELNTIGTSRENLQNELRLMQEAMMGAAKHIADIRSKHISKTLQNAINAFNNGQLDLANSILDSYLKDVELSLDRLDQNIKLLHQHINALQLQAKTLMADTTTVIDDRIKRVIDIYNKADNWAGRSNYDKEKYAQLLSDYAKFLCQYGYYYQAEQVYIRQIDLAEQCYGIDNPYTAKSYNEIGQLYGILCDFSKAFEYTNKALSIITQVKGDDTIDAATSFEILGSINFKIGNIDKALKYNQKALDIFEKTSGLEHYNTATAYNSIGLIYYSQDDYDNALKFYLKALNIFEKELGKDHPETATSYNNIGMVYYSQRKYSEALEYLFRALDIQETLLGIEHPDTATSYDTIGRVYNSQKNLDKALEYLNKALDIRVAKLGPNHPDTRKTLTNIENIQRYKKNLMDTSVPLIESYTIGDVVFNMVYVEGGSFMMGATPEQGKEIDESEKPIHQVDLTDYRIGETPVTQALWETVMGENPSKFKGNPNRPVECVSWNDCRQFIHKLNKLTGKNFRLPTEAEWEFAARGGKKSKGYKYAGSNIIDDVAWYDDNSHDETHPVAQLSPNELGIYDMSGNVWEWCQDRFSAYSPEVQTNPIGQDDGKYRVFRGGSWYGRAWFCRASKRGRELPVSVGNYLGLRLAL